MPHANHDERRRYQRTYQRDRKRKLRFECIRQLGGKCADCPEDDPTLMEFDHVRGVKVAEIGNLLRLAGGLSNPILQAELKKCELRCLACHMVKDGRLIRDKWNEFRREGKSSIREDYREPGDESPITENPMPIGQYADSVPF